MISGLGLGLGLETSGLGLGLGLETPGFVNIPGGRPIWRRLLLLQVTAQVSCVKCSKAAFLTPWLSVSVYKTFTV